jgi:hypothetical protein
MQKLTSLIALAVLHEKAQILHIINGAHAYFNYDINKCNANISYCIP